jgi:hypothetical protein
MQKCTGLNWIPVLLWGLLFVIKYDLIYNNLNLIRHLHHNLLLCMYYPFSAHHQQIMYYLFQTVLVTHTSTEGLPREEAAVGSASGGTRTTPTRPTVRLLTPATSRTTASEPPPITVVIRIKPALPGVTPWIRHRRGRGVGFQGVNNQSIHQTIN